jgi:flavodoxin
MAGQHSALVIYYSFEGNTRYVAEQIAQAVGADLLELRTREEPQTKGFLKYAWGGAQVVMRRKPALEPWDVDLDAYQTLFIGTPVWAFTYAPPLRSFFATRTVRDKRIALFCTHEGGPVRTLLHMRRALEGNRIVGERGFLNPRARAAEVAEEARRWARETMASL